MVVVLALGGLALMVLSLCWCCFFLQNIPPPPLLVLDVEKTILGSEWDSKYGWRHAMRPGVHEFLKEVSTVRGTTNCR